MRLFNEDNNFFTRNVENLINGGIIIHHEVSSRGITLEFAHREIAEDFSDNIAILTSVTGRVNERRVYYSSGGLLIIHAIGRIYENQLSDMVQK